MYTQTGCFAPHCTARQVPPFKTLLTHVRQIHADKLTQTAQKQWSSKAISSKAPPAFQPQLVASIYKDELSGGSDAPPALKRVMLLEVSQYLENYLWPNFDPATASFEHIMSIILMVNEKFREGVPAWTCFHSREVGIQDRVRLSCCQL
jgi:intron-binding protein aquarius